MKDEPLPGIVVETRGQQAADKLIAALDKTYDLVYVSYDDRLGDEQVDALLRGDFETLDESMSEWESESRWESCKYIIGELVKNELDDEEQAFFEDDTEGWDEVRFAIEDRDSSDHFRQLARHTGSVMLRIEAVDEDDAWSFEPIEVDELLTKLGLPKSDANRSTAADIINNASPEYSVCMGYWLASVDVGDLYDLLTKSDAPRLAITNPGFWLGNPFTGSGYADQFEGEITVAREDLHTDKGAFGYGWQEVACCSAGAFPVTIKEVK